MCMICAERIIGSYITLEVVLISMQDRCTVCAIHAIGSEVVLGIYPIELPGDVGQEEARLGPFGESVNLSAR
jgi:hypothetical protein